MAAKKRPDLGVNLSSFDSSIDSAFFKGIQDDSNTLDTFDPEDGSYSVQTPSINEDSVGSYTMGTYGSSEGNTANEPFTFDDSPTVQTEMIEKNKDDDNVMDKSAFKSVIDTLIHSIVGREDDDKAARSEQQEPVSELDDEEKYDDFMNDFSNKSVDIMRKRSVGLAKVMSTIDQNGFQNKNKSNDNGDAIDPFASCNGIDFDNPDFPQSHHSMAEKDFDAATDYDTITPSVVTTQTKSTKRDSRSRLMKTGVRGVGHRRTRSKSRDNNSLAGTADASTITGDAVSIGLSVSSKRSYFMKKPPSGLKKKTKKKVTGSVTKRDLQQRRDLEVFLSEEKYEEMFALINENPKLIAIQVNQPSGKTFLHIIAGMPVSPPENVVLKVISFDTSLVTVTDDNNNTPLHFASQHVRKGNIHVFMALLKFHPMGASERNSDGDLPLHIVASNPVRGSEEAAHMLLEINSKAITGPNKKGKIPLHLALSEGSKNLKLLLKIVYMHKFRRSPVDVLDTKGNSPLHCAILNGTNYGAINLFNREIRDSHLQAYIKENEQGYIPLHLSLRTKKVDSLIILSLIKAAPFTAGMPTPGGDMPVALATKATMKPEIIKLLLASDLPVELGNKNGRAGMGAIVQREHGHSWWHVAVECQSRYVDVITSLLSNHATFVQIVALVRCLGPDRRTRTIDAISASLEGGLRNLLRFYHRYEISMTRMPVCSNEIQSFAARDHGHELEKMKVTGPWLNDGFTSIEENDRKMKADNDACEIEYVQWNNESKEVTLRCYAFDDSFDAEKKYREEHNISSKFFEDIVNIHTVTNYASASFTSGKLLCIAFEKSDLSLRELMDDVNTRSNRNWLVKCHLILKNLAGCLDHLHNESLVHGYLDATSIGEFQSKLKVMYIGQSVKLGNSMGGSMRRCIPPESLSGTKPSSNFESSMSRSKKKSRKKQLLSPSLSKSKSKSSTTRNRGATSVMSSTMKGSSGIQMNSGLPPLPNKEKNQRKKFGVFVFGMKDLGLGDYGRGKSRGSSRRGGSVTSERSTDSSVGSNFGMDNATATTDEGSSRIIAMQEDEIARLQQALQEKEHIYRRQLIEERAEFKRQEVERQRVLQKTQADILSRARKNLFQFAPEKVMASPTWDIWSFGLLMVELILGKTPLLPSFADSDDEFIQKLMLFGDTQVATIREEVREVAGDLAADLVARLLHPKPLQRIESMVKVTQHRYFHEEVVETKQIFGRSRRRNSFKTSSRDGYQMESKVERGRNTSKILVGTRRKSRSVSRRKGLK